VGLERASSLLLRARLVDGAESHRLGLVSECADDPLATALEIAREIAREGRPEAIAATRRLLWQGAEADFLTAAQASGQALLQARAGAEHQEALAAFRRRQGLRKP
jgi:enoyl-CoA hydratase/carnithine racemase